MNQLEEVKLMNDKGSYGEDLSHEIITYDKVKDFFNVIKSLHLVINTPKMFTKYLL
jgi:hypothetical protein